MNAEGFRWHPAARLFRADGGEEKPAKAPPGPVILEEEPARALALALAAGDCFAIRSKSGGGEGGMALAPEPSPLLPVFETLTSGSSGMPRRIRRSQASWLRSFAVNAGLFGIGPGRRLAVPGRLVHSLALYGALEGMHLGADMHILAGLRPDRQHRALAARRIDTLYATPAQLRLLCGFGPLPELRLLLCGGSKLDPKLRADLAELAPLADLREFYGAAETSFITMADAQTPPDSVGRPYPGVGIRVASPAADGTGEILVRSPYLFERYGEGLPGIAAAAWQEGWLSIGEMGRLEGGCLYLSGRRGRMVTVADQNVFPEEIEGLMESLPGISRAAILAEPDPLRGSVLYAVAMGDPGSEASVMAELKARLGALKAPRRILWRQDWPELASGKTDFAALRAAASGAPAKEGS